MLILALVGCVGLGCFAGWLFGKWMFGTDPRREEFPRTADGVAIFPGSVVYIENPDASHYERDEVLRLTVDGLGYPKGFDDYRGAWNVLFKEASIECGDGDCYSTRGACVASLGYRDEEVGE